MRTRPFGPAQLDVPVMGQGTWNMEHDRARSVAALRRGIELGLTHIDTAEMYGDGAVEELVGDAVAGAGVPRESLFIVSKVLPSNASRDGAVRACERSLRRLRVDYLDVYLLHWRGAHPLSATVSAFEQLVDDGKIRSWGVSNIDVDDMDELFALGPAAARCACNQVLLHLEERYAAGALLEQCRDRSVALVGYSPLGQGALPRGALLDDIARKHAATPAQVALAFLALDDGVFLIPKASSVEHVEQNARALDVKLDDDDAARLRAAYPVRGRRLSSI